MLRGPEYTIFSVEPDVVPFVGRGHDDTPVVSALYDDHSHKNSRPLATGSLDRWNCQTHMVLYKKEEVV